MQEPPSDLNLPAFRHVVVPIGVVIGMGVAHIVRTLAEYLAKRSEVRFLPTHAAWTVIALTWFLGLWWILWRFRDVGIERWSFFALILMLLGPAALYLAVILLLPAMRDDEVLDLGARFDRVQRPFFVCLSLVMVWLGTTEVVLLREDWLVPHRFAQGSAIVLLGVGAMVPTRRTASVLAVVFTVACVVAFATFRGTLG